MSEREVRELLRSHGFRSTRGRVDLLTALRSAQRPLTHTQILHRLSGAKYNRVSIYRALEALTEAGLVHRAYLDGRIWAFETADRCEHDRCHPHFTCTRCGAVECMTEITVPMARGLPKGYVVERQKVHIDGLCPRCAHAGFRPHKRRPGGE